jgi:hypothetical protein
MGRGSSGVRAEAQAKRPVARCTRNAKDPDVSALRENLAQASEQLEAIGDILSVMSASPSDVRPVLNDLGQKSSRRWFDLRVHAAAAVTLRRQA